jgi:hypothetical protein
VSPRVLSITVTMPRAFATATMAGISCTSKVRLPGLSRENDAGCARSPASRSRRRSAGRNRPSRCQVV